MSTHAKKRLGLLGFATTLILAPALAAPARSAGLTNCGWPFKSDPDVLNIAWPDESATYWAAPFYATPGSTMTIRGQFPLARYMSFHIYEGSIAVDHLADNGIRPAAGTNPFTPGARRQLGGSYVLHVVFGSAPQHRAPDTLYAASLNGEPNVAGVLMYRLYLPHGSGTGQVPLPQIQYTSASNAELPCPDTGSLDNGQVNELIRTSSLPADWPLQAPPISTPASWGLARSGDAATSVGPVNVNAPGSPYFPNLDNTYLSLTAYRDRGAVVAFRAKAPTFTDTARARFMPTAQVRYWSVCANDYPSTRYVACLPDQAVHVDREGYFTVVISDPWHKPSNLLRTDNWLPAGPYPDTFVLYRQMLADPSFSQAVQFAPSAAQAPATMGAYYPDTRVCGTAAFEKNRCGLQP